MAATYEGQPEQPHIKTKGTFLFRAVSRRSYPLHSLAVLFNATPLLLKTMVVLVVLHVSAPYFMLESNRRIFVSNGNTLVLLMFMSCINSPLALPILA